MQLFKSSDTIVKEIHNEFDTAQERLLNEARSIINNTSQFFSDKAERLEKVGFVNSELVVKHKKNMDVHVKNKEQAELIEYYKQTYPFQKFLTEGELDRICNKYNLIYAPVANYKKEVPEKNLQEIESVSELKLSDCAENYVVFKCWCAEGLSLKENIQLLKGVKVKATLFQESSNSMNLFHALGRHVKCTYQTIDYKAYHVEIKGLFIAAPKSHFSLTGLNKTGLFGFVNMTLIEPKDPIVFRYCRGGIQVISKWGLESENINLVNEKMN